MKKMSIAKMVCGPAILLAAHTLLGAPGGTTQTPTSLQLCALTADTSGARTVLYAGGFPFNQSRTVASSTQTSGGTSTTGSGSSGSATTAGSSNTGSGTTGSSATTGSGSGTTSTTNTSAGVTGTTNTPSTQNGTGGTAATTGSVTSPTTTSSNGLPVVTITTLISTNTLGSQTNNGGLAPGGTNNTTGSGTTATSNTTGGGTNGTFQITRTGTLTNDLTVFYRVSGTAVGGRDYRTITNNVTLAANTASTNIIILPIHEMGGPLRLTSTIQVQLRQPPSGPQTYTIGTPSNAVVTLADVLASNTNATSVEVIAPRDGSTFQTGSEILLVAVASSTNTNNPATNGLATTGTAGTTANGTAGTAGTAGNQTATNATGTAGGTTATASNSTSRTATNSTGRASTSGSNTNTASGSGSSTTTGTSGNTTTNAVGGIASVEFFANTRDLGAGVPVQVDPTNDNGPLGDGGADDLGGTIWAFDWRNAPTGTYVITAVATDVTGAVTISEPVTITVRPRGSR